MTSITYSSDLESTFLGMDDYDVFLELSGHHIKLKYVGEPPHGDSFHELFINNTKFNGFAWGCNFLFPYKQSYVVFSWMKDKYERKTVIIDLSKMAYTILPSYFINFKVENNLLCLSNDEFKTNITLLLSDIKKWFSIE